MIIARSWKIYFSWVFRSDRTFVAQCVFSLICVLFLVLFFSGIITLMVMVGNLAALLFTSGGILHLVCICMSNTVPSSRHSRYFLVIY